MIRRDPTARFEQAPSGCNPVLFGRSEDKLVVRFRAGKYTWGAITQAQYGAILAAQRVQAVQLGRIHDKGRMYWMFHDEFYWEDEGYSQDEVTALILDRQNRKQRRISNAYAKMEMADDESARSRQPIPEDVKVLVWRRDGGKCVECGSRERLEYDHIIPLAKGGSNTARNIQLLCESCNRAKGSNLF